MAGTLNTTYFPTVLDMARRMDPGGAIADIAEIITQYNEILDDIGWKQGNLETGEQITVRTSKPTPSFRYLNKGIQPVKTTTGQIVETCAIMEMRNHIDIDVAMLNGNTAAYRLSEDKGIMQALGDQLASTLIYGDTTVSPEQFTGLAARYYSSTGNNTTQKQVITAGGSNNVNSSIWLVVWSPDNIYGIVPKGSKAGLQFRDLGELTLPDPNNSGYFMQMLCSWYQWKCGLAIRDYRSVVRIANIDITNLATTGATTDNSADLLKYMSLALDRVPPNVIGRKVFYMNETVRSYLRLKIVNKTNLLLRLEEIKGTLIPRPDQVLMFLGCPCRRIDAILSTETNI
jgi:hypothetical protein